MKRIEDAKDREITVDFIETKTPEKVSLSED
jgi:hypothetical protein